MSDNNETAEGLRAEVATLRAQLQALRAQRDRADTLAQQLTAAPSAAAPAPAANARAQPAKRPYPTATGEGTIIRGRPLAPELVEMLLAPLAPADLARAEACSRSLCSAVGRLVRVRRALGSRVMTVD